MQNKLRFIFIWGLVLWSTFSFSNPIPSVYELDSIERPKDWFNLDPQDNGVMGTSTNKAYSKLLQGKEPKEVVVVAVIDSGVDINHEDLKGKIWVNEDEIPGNNIDDDRNGYVDDVNGWNFIGGPDGSNIGADSYELTREYVRLKPIYAEAEPEKIKKRDQEEYAYWLSIKNEWEEKRKEAEMNFNFTSSLQGNLTEVARILKTALGQDDVTMADLAELKSEDEAVIKAAAMVGQLFQNVGQEDASLNDVLADLEGAVKHYENQLEFAFNPDFNPRGIVGDNPDNYKERIYGNDDVIGPDASHGTHVSGIIVADRNNDIGMRGISEHALIMPIRAVPDGDERDKDIANSIYYAVDNGADIINMSFGKGYSPGKKYVDRAVKFAKRKGVILIHAAGNSGEELKRDNNFPNKWLGKKKVATNWVEVGASAWEDGVNLPGSFSNYSQDAVDLFAPGVDIYSTIPEDKYDAFSGTSMAAPVVSGVTALLLAYYPDLKPQQIRNILQQSVYDQSEEMVNKPGDDEKVAFGSLSITGGIVNAYKALQLAESLNKGGK